VARYKLISQHYSEEDKLLEAGTEVGDGTEHAWTRAPTAEMEALDDDAKQRLQKEKIRSGDHIAPLEDLPMTMAEATRKYDNQVEDQSVQLRRQQAATAADRARR
jgi:hypothetical protein